MDYCSLCQRYLNGALTCPGCGRESADATATAALPEQHTAAPEAEFPPAPDAEGTAPAGEGRGKSVV